ncbi:MAG: anthranilate phosphoribosyltransferase [Lachnospiraceae bacterium]|nr:anthranilate phosphoribosyltransferase [Lachnospiraceae bacterium]
MIREAISKLMNGDNITGEEAGIVMDEIMRGEATQAQTSAFLIALHVKGETVEEISACADSMRKFAAKVDRGDMDVLEIVGTGGDRSNTFNISTASAFVVSAAGVRVAKHGNRAASSKCGAADCLEAMGCNLMIEPGRNEQILKETNMCFMFAQKYHSAMKYVAPVRKEIGVPTVFNILGPLSNPAYNNYQLLGVYSEELMEPMARVLYNIGVTRAMVVHGKDGLDEISVCAPTSVVEMTDGKISRYEISPEQFGFQSYDKSELTGGLPAENAEILRSILRGDRGAKRNAVLLNAGAALHIAKQITIEEGVRLAAHAIDSGEAYAQMERFVKACSAGAA